MLSAEFPLEQAPAAFAEAARRWHGFQENAILHQLKRDVHQTVIVGEAHGISARNACCSAEAGE